MYSICIIWVAFIPIYFGTTAASGTGKNPKNNYKVKYSSYIKYPSLLVILNCLYLKIQLTTMAMCLSLSATVILFCLFSPKLRIVLLKPSKNVRGKSNVVKSVYKNHQEKIKNKNDTLAVQSTNPTFNEKSLTLATGVSISSTASSPGNLNLFFFIFLNVSWFFRIKRWSYY